MGVGMAILLLPRGGHAEVKPGAALPSPLDAEADAETVRDEVTVSFHQVKGRAVADVTEEVELRLLRAEGRDRVRVRAVYTPGFSEVMDIMARVTPPRGAPSTLDRRKAHDMALGALKGEGIYSDERAVLLPLDVREPGTVVAYRHTVRHFEPRLFQFGHYFGGRLPARRVRLVVRAPEDWDVEYLARRGAERIDWAPSMLRQDGAVAWTWERQDLLPEAREVLMPVTGSAPYVSVRLAGWTEGQRKVKGPQNVRELSAWLYGLVAERAQGTPEIARLAQGLVAGLTDPRERARRLYSWVRDQVQYYAVEVGYGAWRPHAPDEVQRVRYGDCKDKANLLHVLLAAVGVQSRLAAIYHHDGQPRRFGLPTVTGNFNHVILLVDLPGGLVAADPTSRAVPFGELPVGDQEAEVLPFEAAGADLAVMPASTAADNAAETVLELTLSPEGGASGRVEHRVTGGLASEVRQRLLQVPSEARVREVLLPAMGLRAAELREVALEAAAPPEAPMPLVLRAEISLPTVVQGSGAMRLLRLADLLRLNLPALTGDARQSALELPLRWRRLTRIVVTLPEGFGVSGPPGPIGPVAPITIESPMGRYRLTATLEGRSLTIERLFELREHVIAAAAYPAFRQFLEQTLVAEERPIILRRN